jgi:hypothetical protein
MKKLVIKADRAWPALLLILCGCFSSGPQLVRRYKAVKPANGEIVRSIPELGGAQQMDLSVISIPLDPPGTIKLKDLSDKGQSAYIEQLAKWSKSPDELRAALSQPIEEPKLSTDATKSSRKIVITVSKDSSASGRYRPADRLEWTKVTIKPLDSCFKFQNWSLLQTDYSTIDLGKVTYSRTGTLFGSFGLISPPTLPVGLSASTQASRSATAGEEIALKRRYEAITPIMRPDSVEIIREGNQWIDLTGNTVFDVTIVYDYHKQGCATLQDPIVQSVKLFDQKSGTALLPSEASLSEAEMRYFAAADPMKVSATLKCIDRVVLKGTKSNNEADHNISYLWCGAARTIDLIPGEDLNNTLWGLKTVDDQNPVVIRGANIDRHTILFSSYEMADQVRLWFSAAGNPRSLGTYEVGTVDIEGKFHRIAKNIALEVFIKSQSREGSHRRESQE